MENRNDLDGAGAEHDKSREIIRAHFSDMRILEIGNPVEEQKNAVFIPEYTGELVKAESEDVIAVIAYLPKSARFIYSAGDRVTMSYPGDGKLHIFPARITGTREASDEDIAKIAEVFRARLDNLGKIIGPVRFVVIDALVLDEPQQHQRRQYPRSKVKWNVYFKILNPDEKLETAQKKWISEKLFECDRGYLKTQTVDVSAGGFKSEIKAQIPRGTHIECVIEIKAGKFKAIGRIDSRVVDCPPNDSKPGFYDMHVQFMDLSDSLKSAMSSGDLAKKPNKKKKNNNAN